MMCGRHGNRHAELNHDHHRQLRDGLGKFATGITVVTCASSTGLCGITANSFSSVSLEPPLVLWNIAKVSRALKTFLEARHFAINVLSEEQEALSVHFAQADRPGFGDVPHELSARGVPLLSSTLACFECRTHEIHDCGDHHIIVGEVENFRFDDGKPLVFYASRYARLAGAT
jgi:flavin reductase (DIM6/NTAB) family NADH-FMN oxidoreductase RutF